VYRNQAKPGLADWDQWSQMPKAELWEAVVLSLDASPEDREATFNWIFGSGGGHSDEDSRFLRECRRRMKVAQASVSMNGALKPLVLYSGALDDPRTKISLPLFGDWASGLGWQLPTRFPQTLQPAAQQLGNAHRVTDELNPTAEKGLSKRERDTLLKLVIGMAIEGYCYDPTATRNEAPAEISGDLAKLGIEVTDDTVRKWLREAATTVLPDKPRKT
jgi:hypothetical protein